MAVSNAADSIDERRGSEPDAVFQFVAAVYGGVLLAGLTTTAAALASDTPTALVTTYVASLLVGSGSGLAIARFDRQLPSRLGRTFVRRLTPIAPVVVLGVAVVGAWLLSLEAYVDVVALPSAVLVFVTGHMLSQLAETRYVSAVVGDDPVETWAWTPPGSMKRDGVLVVLYLLLAAGNAIVGNGLQALLWVSLGGLWVGNCLVDGRWEIGPGVERIELQWYDVGLVKRRPYGQSLVRWDDIDHVRQQRGDVVLARGRRDVRFGPSELEDPDAFLEAVAQQLATRDTR